MPLHVTSNASYVFHVPSVSAGLAVGLGSLLFYLHTSPLLDLCLQIFLVLFQFLPFRLFNLLLLLTHNKA